MTGRTKLVLFGCGAAALAVLVESVSLVRHGLSALDEPSAIEVLAARNLRHWAVPSDLRQAKNPIPLTPEVLTEARAHFADHCATCHGNDGKGDSGLGKLMYPKTPDMTLTPTQSLSDGELFSTIENGIRLTGMPGFGGGTAESAHGSWTLVHFIRHLPELTPEEIAEMQQLNPKSPSEREEAAAEDAFLADENGDPAAPAPAEEKAPPHAHEHPEVKR